MNMRRLKPSPALVLAMIALLVAMGGVGYSATKLKAGSVKTKAIKNGAVTESKLANGAVSSKKFATNALAPNAAKLNGVAPGGCQAGWIKGTLVIDTTGAPAAYTDVPGFNCTGGSVQYRRTAVGEYDVRFTGNDSGSAVASSLQENHLVSAYKIGDGEFHVVVEAVNSVNADNKKFALLAF